MEDIADFDGRVGVDAVNLAATYKQEDRRSAAAADAQGTESGVTEQSTEGEGSEALEEKDNSSSVNTGKSTDHGVSADSSYAQHPLYPSLESAHNQPELQGSAYVDSDCPAQGNANTLTRVTQAATGGTQTSSSSVNTGKEPLAKKPRDVEPRELSLLLIGKTGNGKSTLGNNLLGKNGVFPVGRGMTSLTREASVHEADRDGYHLKVVDTPDISYWLGQNTSLIKSEINYWEQLAYPGPDAVLLLIRCDVRYTPEELAIYHQIRDHWGDSSLCRILLVVFTFGDRLNGDILDEAKGAGEELKEVMKDASDRHVVFDAKATEKKKSNQIQNLLEEAGKLQRHCRLMIIGQTGNGKSTLANMLLGKKLFPVSRGMVTATTTPTFHSAQHKAWQLKVLDTPDIKNGRFTKESMEEEVAKWKQFMHPAPHAVIVAVRCDVTYTRNDVDIHRDLFERWEDETVYKKLIVAFTFADHLACSIEEKLEDAYPELQMVVNDAQRRFAVFSSKATEEEKRKQTEKLLQLVNEIDNQDDETHEIRLMIIGRAGMGKSTLGNILLGRDLFEVKHGTSVDSITDPKGELRAVRLPPGSYVMEILDTPDINNSEQKDSDTDGQVASWRNHFTQLLAPHAILLAVSCDHQFTKEEHSLYLKIKERLGEEELTQKLIVAFTFSDQLDQDIREILNMASQELQAVLKDACGRYFVFNGKATNRQKRLQVKEFLQKFEDLISAGKSSVLKSVLSSAKATAGKLKQFFTHK